MSEISRFFLSFCWLFNKTYTKWRKSANIATKRSW